MSEFLNGDEIRNRPLQRGFDPGVMSGNVPKQTYNGYGVSYFPEIDTRDANLALRDFKGKFTELDLSEFD